MARATRGLCEGIYFGEGPRWHEGRLWFSDFYAHAVKSISLAGDPRNDVRLADDQKASFDFALQTSKVRWSDLTTYQGRRAVMELAKQMRQSRPWVDGSPNNTL